MGQPDAGRYGCDLAGSLQKKEEKRCVIAYRRIERKEKKHMRTCDILIQNAKVMTDYETILEQADIAIKDGKILAVIHKRSAGIEEKQDTENQKLPEKESRNQEAWTAAQVIDGRDRLFMPGFIDSHMHTGQQLLKGLVLDAKPIIWTRIMLPFESTLTPEKMKLSAELAALEMIRQGTSGFIDAGSYFMDEAASVYYESGLRGCLSWSTMDEDGLPESIAMTAEEAVRLTDELYETWDHKGNLKVAYGLRALNSCSDRLVELAAGHAADRGAILQAHMNEYQGEIDGIIRRNGVRPYEYLEQMGALSERFLGAHSLLLSEKEKELIKLYQVKTCHCPFSNCGKAVPDTPDLLERGISVGLGTDGAAHAGLSLFHEMRIFRSVMNIYHGVPKKNPRIMPAESLFQMVLEGGAAALGESGRLGRICEGFHADLIGIDLRQPHLMPTGNLLHTIFECADGHDVTDMIVEGKVIMRNRQILTLDEERILYDAEKYRKEQGIEICSMQ